MAMQRPLRVVSLLPSATENFTALLEYAQRHRHQQDPHASLPPLPQLVGRPHDGNVAINAKTHELPILTVPRTTFTSSNDVSQQVKSALATDLALYALDEATLIALAPDVVLMDNSRVCSAGVDTVQQVLLNAALKETQVITLEPRSLEDVLVKQFEQLGHAVGLEVEGNAMAAEHLARLNQLKEQASSGLEEDTKAKSKSKKKKNVLMVEWLDPLFLGKQGWMRDIVEAAGGQVVESDAKRNEVVVIAPCGVSLTKLEEELAAGRVGKWWKTVVLDQAHVFAVDGTIMFTRPTYRLLDALEWLVRVLESEDGQEDATAWLKATEFPFKQIDISNEHVPLHEKENETDQSNVSELPADIEALHEAACKNNQRSYKDPKTGFTVMTALGLKQRGVCCGNGCRHCPFAHVNVDDPDRRQNQLTTPVILRPQSHPDSSVCVGGKLLWPETRANAHLDTVPLADRDLIVVFWSGGKDSMLALTTLYATYAANPDTPMPNVVLLTTIDAKTNIVPIQNVSMQHVSEQASALQLPVMFAPAGFGTEYRPRVSRALQELTKLLQGVNTDNAEAVRPIDALMFGDLHLEDIRAWREQAFGDDYKLLFPVWKKDYETELLPLLQSLRDRCKIDVVYSNVEAETLQTAGFRNGDVYDVDQLRTGVPDATTTAVDLMGERGEFHTRVMFPHA